MPMRPEIDRARLSRDVRKWLADSGLTTRSAAAHFPGLNAAMISRACGERVLSAPSLLVVCSVMRRDPRDYLVLHDSAQRNQTVTAMVPRETRGMA